MRQDTRLMASSAKNQDNRPVRPSPHWPVTRCLAHDSLYWCDTIHIRIRYWTLEWTMRCYAGRESGQLYNKRLCCPACPSGLMCVLISCWKINTYIHTRIYYLECEKNDDALLYDLWCWTKYWNFSAVSVSCLLVDLVAASLKERRPLA